MIPEQCRICEVYGYCTTTEQECIAYQDGFNWKKPEVQDDCTACFTNSYCTSNPKNCDGGEVDRIVGVGTSNQPGNRGLINWVSGPVVNIEKGDYMALVTIQAGNSFMTSMLPLEKFEDLGYAIGDTVTFAIRALNIKILR